ncbi:MAG: ATP-binding protein [archaeon]|nr:ATP-binding protein [archaeon]
MEFIGRAKEMGLLERDAQQGASFTLLTGRRRVGKTRLIKEFLRGRTALYFLATAQNRARLLEDFSDSLTVLVGTAAFTYLASLDREMFVALDEFQNILNSDDGASSEFQYIWDEVLSGKRFHLILCGSHISVLEGLCDDYGSPLYGRFTRRMVLQPLSFDEVRGEYYCASVESYAVLGGVPRYMEMFDDGPLEQNLCEHVFESSSVLFNEPEVLLRGEVKSLSAYMSIMRGVANGNGRLSDIAGAVEIPSTTLGPYLRKLISIRMLRRIVPVTEKDPESSKQALYVIGDNFTMFWFRFVYPYMSFLPMDNPLLALNALHANFIDSHVSFVFEELCREAVSGMTEELGFVPEKVGSWWSGDTEVDVVAVNDTEKVAFLGECKYWDNRPVPHKVLTSLREKSASIRKLDGYRLLFGLFSVTGFDESLLDESDVLLVDRGRVVRNTL